MRRSPARGQATVLFALTLLALVAMVMITLDIGMRTKDRMEAQVAADAAAFSEAVATARAYNAISLLSRAHFAHMVSLAGVQSLISWSGLYVGYAGESFFSLVDYRVKLGGESVAKACDAQSGDEEDCDDDAVEGGPKKKCNDNGRRSASSCLCRAFLNAGNIGSAIYEDVNRAYDLWEQLDEQAGLEAQRIQQQAMQIVAAQYQIRGDLTDKAIRSRTLAQAIAGAASPELKAVGGQQSAQRVFDATDGSGRADMLATMGTRGNPFVSAREKATEAIVERLEGLGRGIDPTFSAAIQPRAAGSGPGGAGFGDDKESSQIPFQQTGWSSWAEDHGGTVTLSLERCGGRDTETATVGDAWVYSTAEKEGGDAHQVPWPVRMHRKPPPESHTLYGSRFNPKSGQWEHGVWPSVIHYNEGLVVDASAWFGQPVLTPVLTRNYGTSGFRPWQRIFSLNWTQGAATELNLQNTDTQYVVSSAIAYYHRPGYFKEPPNLMNPFWRATLFYDPKAVRKALASAGAPVIP